MKSEQDAPEADRQELKEAKNMASQPVDSAE
jgi:hypothetical protein